MANTGNIIVTERDTNPFSPTYDTTRQRTYDDESRCEKETPTWIETSRSCELDGNGLDTGNMIIVETDLNENSSTYGQTRTTTVASLLDCPTDIDGNFKLRVYHVYTDNSTAVTLVQCGHKQSVNYDTTELTSGEWTDAVAGGTHKSISARVGLCTKKICNTFIARSSEKVTDVYIPSSVVEIGNYAFMECTNLTSVNIPDRVTEINCETFRNCYALPSIAIPNGITRIGNGAFENCIGLTTITVPETVTSIGYGAFAIQNGLTSITILATTPPSLITESYTTGEHSHHDWFYGEYPIYVPSESVSAYRTATNWSTYASRIQAIPS